MAYADRPRDRVFSVDTGRLPQETLRADRAAARALPRPQPRAPRAGPRARAADGRAARARTSSTSSVEQRLLCCNVRKVQPLTRAPRRPRRVDHRPAPRPVGDAHEHPQGRDRPRPRRDREAQPARRVDGGRGLGLRPRARRARTTRSTTGATRRSAARRARGRSRPARPRAPGRWWWETNAPKECGIHCAIETGGFEHELHAILGEKRTHERRRSSSRARRARSRSRGAGRARDGAGRRAAASGSPT